MLVYRHHSNWDEMYEIKDTVYEKTLGGSAYIIPEKQIAQFVDGQEGGPLVCFSNSKGRYSEKTWTVSGAACTDIVDKLGVDNTAGENMFSIYPNPSKGIIRVNADQNPTKLEVYSSHGELVFSSETKLETRPLSRQIYAVKLWRNDGLVEVHRVAVE
ncbi:T9SS type A sorting domain-containing protein [Bacteroidia bacterium]|nr:T9SS type A sorting domain-containing protein [Bacteroidia bacterium]